MASFPRQPGLAGIRKADILNYNEVRDDWVAMSSAGLYANHLHFTPDNHASIISVNFYGPDTRKSHTSSVTRMIMK